MKPFDFVSSINQTKQDLLQDDTLDRQNEKVYSSFLTNRSLSYFPDTVAAANLMNQYHQIDSKLQYHFLLNIIRKRKRFSKWDKPEVVNDIDVIKEYYGYSNEKAKSALKLLSPSQIQELKQRTFKGGRK